MISKLALNRTSQFVGRSFFVQPLRGQTLNIATRTFKTVNNIPNKKNLVSTISKRGVQTEVVPKTQYSLNYIVGGAAALGLVGIGVYNLLSSSDESPSFVQARVRSTYMYLGGSLAATAIVARSFFNSGLAQKMLSMHPLALFGLSFVGIIGTSTLVQVIPYENTIPKHLALGAFCGTVAASICPIVAVGGNILLQAAAATGTIVGSLSFVSAMAPEGTFSGLSGPLSIGFGAILAASVGTFFFPASGILYNIVVYGGTALFSAFVLFDTQKMLERSKYSANYDPINNCIGIYMSTINIFLNMVRILSNSNKK
jgi:FtsH-binding integral membrane protein